MGLKAHHQSGIQDEEGTRKRQRKKGSAPGARKETLQGEKNQFKEAGGAAL